MSDEMRLRRMMEALGFWGDDSDLMAFAASRIEELERLLAEANARTERVRPCD